MSVGILANNMVALQYAIKDICKAALSLDRTIGKASLEAVVSLQVGKAHLDLLAFVTGFDELGCTRTARACSLSRFQSEHGSTGEITLGGLRSTLESSSSRAVRNSATARVSRSA